MFTLFLILGCGLTYTVKQPRITCTDEPYGSWGIRLHPEVTNLLGEHYDGNIIISYNAYIIREDVMITYTISKGDIDGDIGFAWDLEEAFELEVMIYTDDPTIIPFTAKYMVGDVDEAWSERDLTNEGVGGDVEL